MTSRERVLAAMARQPVDRVPCVCAFNPLLPTQRRGHTWNFPWPPEASAAERLRYEVEDLGIDSLVNVGIDLTSPADGVTSHTWRDGDLLWKQYETPAGTLRAGVRANADWPHGEDVPFFSDFNVGHFVEPWIQSEQDLACFQQVRRLDDSAARLAVARDALRQARQLADERQVAVNAPCGLGLTGAQHLFGATDLCLTSVDQPGLVDAYLAGEHAINLRAIEVLGESGCVDTIRRNGFYETCDFYSPRQLATFLAARLTAEADCAHAHSLLVSYTLNTGVMPMLDYLAGLPLDSLFGIDIAAPGVDIRAIAGALAETKSFFIGPSSTHHIWGTAASCRQAVRDCFEVFGPTGLILAPCVSSHSIMPWENTLAMIDEWRRCAFAR